MAREFPNESIEKAREIVTKYKQRAKSKKNIASALFNGEFLEINYGFTESIKSGNCGRYLHEITKEADCFTMAGVLYLLAKEAGLNPQLYWASGMKDVNEGQLASEVGEGEHAFITVKLRKNKNPCGIFNPPTGEGRQNPVEGNEIYVLDTQMGIFGKAKLLPEKNIIDIYEKDKRGITHRQYTSLKKISQEEYLEKLEKNRSPEGGRLVLSATQHVVGAGKHPIFVTYLPETCELRTSLRMYYLNLVPEAYKKYYITDLITKVNQDGEFDFKKGRLEFYRAAMVGWTEHTTPQTPLIYPVNSAIELWNFWDYLMKEKGRKSSASRMNLAKLTEEIWGAGFKDNFEIERDSMAEKVVKQAGLQEMIGGIREKARKAAGDFVQRCQQDEISYKVFLRDAHYTKQIHGRKNKENIWGLIYSEQEHMNLLKEGFECYKAATWRLFETIVREREAIIFNNQSSYTSDRRHNAESESRKREVKCFDNMSLARVNKYRRIFNMLADQGLFNRQFDLEKMQATELERGLDEKDLQRGAEDQLFHRLMSGYVDKKSLFLARYQPGLKRILAK